MTKSNLVIVVIALGLFAATINANAEDGIFRLLSGEYLQNTIYYSGDDSVKTKTHESSDAIPVILKLNTQTGDIWIFHRERHVTISNDSTAKIFEYSTWLYLGAEDTVSYITTLPKTE